MALAFVESAVLYSEDGVSFTKEKDIKKEDDGFVSRRPQPGSGKSLGEQLAESKKAKDDEWKEANNPFKPPPGLDEDEYTFYQEVEAKKDFKRDIKKFQDGKDMQEYTAAQMSKTKKIKEEALTTTGIFKRLIDSDTQLPVPVGFTANILVKKGDDKKKKEKKVAFCLIVR